LPLKLLDPNYSTGDTNTVSKSIFEQFTEYTSQGSTIAKFFSLLRAKKPSASEGASPPDPLTRGSAPGPRWGLRPRPQIPHFKTPGFATGS